MLWSGVAGAQVSGEGFRVHLGCGTVLEFEGLQPTGPQLAGHNKCQWDFLVFTEEAIGLRPKPSDCRT